MDQPPEMKRHPLVRNIVERPRLLISVVIGGLAMALMPSDWRLPSRLLIAWNLATWIYLAAALWAMSRANRASIKKSALLTDEGRYFVLTFACVAAFAAMAAIFAQLPLVKDTHGLLRAMHLGLAAATIVSAWAFTHVIYAQHYAHEYFIERDSETDCSDEDRGGLHFPGTLEPDAFDFLYFSMIIGVASQTADVEITASDMRRISLVHSLISFFFNTTILALTINIASGLFAP